ncbi:uncharacterized protein LOC118647956 [Monomorium pharaonis]|uniref:uncharacterized protein LOC118647956 n=1 Tax=Monomorium pharaonis TaxID=307658 RepID=UPI0017465FD1|nr:uncharacterized protein LOC118647956 [Monomorium pharaonis]
MFYHESFGLQYTYSLNKTTVVFREPLQTIQLIASLLCRNDDDFDSLFCFLYNIKYESSLRYKTLTEPTNIIQENIKFNSSFRIKFNATGVDKIFTCGRSPNEDIMKEIGNLFNIGNELKVHIKETHPRVDGQQEYITFDVQETISLGRCDTCYNIKIEKEKNEKIKKLPHFQVIFLEFKNKGNINVHLEKNRLKCNYSREFTDFMIGMEMTEHTHLMKVFDNKFEITTIRDVQLPFDIYNSEYKRVFRETTLLNLNSISVSSAIPLSSIGCVWTIL